MPAADAADVEARWQRIKDAEKSRSSVTDGVPHSLPALTQAAKLMTRLDNAGRPVPVEPAAAAAVSELAASGLDPAELVLAAIAFEREAGRDPDAEFRSRVRAFRERILAAEQAEAE